MLLVTEHNSHAHLPQGAASSVLCLVMVTPNTQNYGDSTYGCTASSLSLSSLWLRKLGVTLSMHDGGDGQTLVVRNVEEMLTQRLRKSDFLCLH